MPVYLPAVQGVQRSAAVAESMASATAQQPLLLTLALYHPLFVDDDGNPVAAYVVNDFRDLVATIEAGAPLDAGAQVTFRAVPFRFTRQERADTAAPGGASLELDNVSLAVTRLLSLLRGSNVPVTARLRVYMSGDTSAPHEMPVPTVYLSDVEVSVDTVTAAVVDGEFGAWRFPVDEYTREQWPALEAGV
jgi:hypothetical protein